MKRVLLNLLILGLMPVIAFSQTRENRPVAAFSKIEASSVFDITVEKGSSESLAIEADEEALPYVHSEVQDGVLHLYIDNKAYKIEKINLLKAYIVMKDLDRVTLSGACKFTSEDLFTSNKFECGCSGASSLSVNVNTNQLDIEMSGAGKILIKAEVADEANLNMSGASKVQGELTAGNVFFNSSGICSVELTGSATDLNMDVSGASKIMAENFMVKTATIKSSGVSKVRINVSDSLKVDSSGPSSVSYAGSPTIEVNNSKMARINKI